MSGRTCYWCGAPETSTEHVPPECLYPELKDGYDVPKKNWIKVPSCEAHNSKKSKDDEHLLCVVAVSIQNNAIGLTQALTKVRRALRRSPGLVRAVIPEYEKVMLRDEETGKSAETARITVDTRRILNSLEHIARAIYFHHKGVAWAGQVLCYPEFLRSVKSSDSAERNTELETVFAAADDIFSSLERRGDNPEVFYYQFYEDSKTSRIAIRLTFYGGTRATVTFTPSTT